MATVAEPVQLPAEQGATKRERAGRLTPHNVLLCFRLVLRLVGGLVSLFFAFLGIWIFVHPHFNDFWQFCNWMGRALLHVVAGLAGCYLEARGLVSFGHFASFACNRVATGLFYLWLGFYVLGDEDTDQYEWLQTLTQACGILSWIAGVGDFLVACTSEDRQPTHGGTSPKADSVGASDAADTADAPSVQPSAIVSQAHSPIAIAAPPGGWNTSGTNPFGEP